MTKPDEPINIDITVDEYLEIAEQDLVGFDEIFKQGAAEMAGTEMGELFEGMLRVNDEKLAEIRDQIKLRTGSES
jgi:hypothetical protein